MIHELKVLRSSLSSSEHIPNACTRDGTYQTNVLEILYSITKSRLSNFLQAVLQPSWLTDSGVC